MSENLSLEPDALWRAVTERDRNYDGVLFFAVAFVGFIRYDVR